MKKVGHGSGPGVGGADGLLPIAFGPAEFGDKLLAGFGTLVGGGGGHVEQLALTVAGVGGDGLAGGIRASIMVLSPFWAFVCFCTLARPPANMAFTPAASSSVPEAWSLIPKKKAPNSVLVEPLTCNMTSKPISFSMV